MKTITTPLLLAFSLLALSVLDLRAGTIFYQPISATQSDASSGISTNNQYTTAIDGGNKRGTDRMINGITLYALVGNEQSSAADNCTVNVLAGSFSNAGGTSGSIRSDGVFKDVLSDMTFNTGAADGSQQEIVLNPESLEAGATYDLRIYIGNFGGQNRLVNLAFVGDGQTPVETGFFNEDDARTSGGAFADPNQVYYINYRFTWDGESTPGVTITQKSGSAPFVLYALTNQLVSVGAATAEVAAPPSAPAAPPMASGQALTTGLVSATADQIGVESDDFYSSASLNDNGQWIDIENSGRCWMPTRVSKGWRPYTAGTFRYSDDDGWVFVSDEPWAWAVYHYGRWVKIDFGSGWAWVPGTAWSGAWVSWRKGTTSACDCIAWAPLPPEVAVDTDVGVASWVDEVYDIGPEYYNFVDVANFIDTAAFVAGGFFGGDVIYDFNRTIDVFNDTVNITNISVTNVTNITNINNVNVANVNIHNGGPDYGLLDKEAGKHGKDFGKILVDREGDIGGFDHGKNSKMQGNKLTLHSPDVTKDGTAKHVPKTDTHLASNKVDHGWNKVKNDKTKNDLKNHIAQENKGRNPSNTKATLPTDLAQKSGKHPAGEQAGKAAQAGVAGAVGQHPGKKGQLGAAGTTTGAAGAAGAMDQHLGKKGQLGAAGTTTGAAGVGGAMDQHPGKKGQLGAAGTTTGAAGVGGAMDQHPGKKGQLGAAGTTTGAAGVGGAMDQHPGKKGQLGAAGPTTGAAGVGGAMDQHPGKKGQLGAAGTTTGAAGVGGAMDQHPGKKGQLGAAGTTTGAAGVGRAVDQHPGKKGQLGAAGTTGTTQAGVAGAQQAGATEVRGKGKKGQIGAPSTTTGPSQAVGATGTTSERGKGTGQLGASQSAGAPSSAAGTRGKGKGKQQQMGIANKVPSSSTSGAAAGKGRSKQQAVQSQPQTSTMGQTGRKQTQQVKRQSQPQAKAPKQQATQQVQRQSQPQAKAPKQQATQQVQRQSQPQVKAAKQQATPQQQKPAGAGKKK